MDVHLEGWPTPVSNRERLAQRRQYLSLYQRNLQLARQQQRTGRQLSSDERVRSRTFECGAMPLLCTSHALDDLQAGCLTGIH